ncbi:MAG: leucine-rich repeat domain-containing protein, partial [Lachnospiraceae bacterium]|nr:leucine-rich repeat domain-containing protein [Lachnospiraceae bacterium]
MAKNSSVNHKKKTGNRKMKRTVRRTIGALCMVSAITVAAIPVPDVEATYSPTANPVQEYSTLGITTEAEGVNLTMANAENGAFAGNTTTSRSYTLKEIGNGIYFLDRQFDVKSNAQYNNGFITGYNKLMNMDTIDITSNLLFCDYIYLTGDAITGFTDKTSDPAQRYMNVTLHIGETDTVTARVERLGYQYSLPVDPNDWTMITSSPEYNFFYTNFQTDMNNYKTLYEQSQADSSIAAPAQLVRSYADLPKYSTDDARWNCLCSRVLFGGENDDAITANRATMYTYDDAGNQLDTPPLDLIIFKYTSPQTQINTSSQAGYTSKKFFTDHQNYVNKTAIQLIGIAENALSGEFQINRLLLGDNIKYVCDRAFYRSTMLQDIKFGNATQIGNQTFCHGEKLTQVDLNGVISIGKEAFAHTKVTGIEIPETVTMINKGAFYDCKLLTDVKFVGTGTTPTVVDDGAFCDCAALRNVNFGDRNVSRVGNYGFAITDTSLVNKDGLNDFTYPRYITEVEDLGEFALANRNALKTVTLSSGLQITPEPRKVPSTLVARCANLEYFRFPVETSGVNYDPEMFYDVKNPKFYVWGPESFTSDYAKPRKCTWAAKMNVAASPVGGDPVTYMYYKGDNESNPPTYEVSNGKLIQGIDANGQLVNCTYVPGTDPVTDWQTDLIIDDSVAGIQIKSIASDCFNIDVKNNVTGIVIDDGNGIETLEAGVFKDFENISYVNLGNGVKNIGTSAFESCDKLKKATIGENIENIGQAAFKGCPQLVDIYFDSPGDLTTFKRENIGPEAFQTGSPKLTIHGEIGSEYGPFVFAMSDDTFANAGTGLRVCYKTPVPSALTVLLDNKNGYPTLVDIPHYEDIKYYHDLYAADMALSGNDVLYARGDGTYSDYKTYYDLYNDIQAGHDLTPVEQDALNAMSDIYIPTGIKSIDVMGYINGNSKNPNGYAGRYDNKVNTTAYIRIGADGGTDPYYSDYMDHGLFNGFCASDGSSARRDYPDADPKEEIDLGNDRITKVTMEDVTYLPTKAFDSCEQLENVILGDDLTDPGVLPFYRCPNLIQATGNSAVYSENGILYKNGTDADGNPTKTLVECFASRGGKVGSNMVSTNNDPAFAEITDISEGAFSACPTLRFVDFEGVDKITEIPKDCFKDSNNIRNIDLPVTIDTIEEGAFDVES